MTQTVTGSGLGISDSSSGLGSYGGKGTAALGQGKESVYVNAANGNLIVRQSDGFLANSGFGLDLMHTYNSRGEGGSSWFFNVQSRLELHGTANEKGSYVIRVNEDGHQSRFVWDTARQAYRPEEGGTANLVFAENRWTYREGSAKTAYHYNAQGQLTQLCDKDGHDLSFHYQKGQLEFISDVNDKQKIIWSFAQGVLKEVTTTSEGKTIHHIQFEYDAHQRLQQVRRDLGNGKSYWITYDYEGDSNLINTITQSDGTQLHIKYDAQGRVRQLIDGEGRISTYTYLQGQTKLSNGLGESWIYFYDEHNRLTGVDGPEHYRIRYVYEGTQLSCITQGSQVWHYRYNEAGDCVYLQEPNGQVTLRTYDAEHHLLAETKYQSFDGEHYPIHPKTTRYVYDEQGHLRFEVAAEGTVTEYRYGQEGQLTSSRCYVQASFNLSRLREEDVLDLKLMSDWASQQNQQQVRLIDYHYDWRGQLNEEIHYREVDVYGQGIETQANHTQTVYDAAGRLIARTVQTAKGWSTTHYVYDDLGRLTQTMDNQHNSEQFDYDDVHQRITQTDANGLQTVRIYDRSGLLLATTRLDTAKAYGSIRYYYDAAGQLSAETGVDGLSTYFFYDAQGRVVAKVTAQGEMVQYRYNEEGLLIQTHQYEQRVNTQGWLSARPKWAEIIPPGSTKDSISQIIYNQYNQVVYSVNAEGAVIGYVYDAEGHVLEQTAYAMRLKDFNPTRLYTFADITVNQDHNDRRIVYYYDVAGHVQAEINAEGYATEYRYNHLGQLIETCRYSEVISSLLTREWVKDKPKSMPKDIHTYSIYDAQGVKVAEVDGENYLIEYRYTIQGLLQERIAYKQPVNNSILIDEYTLLDYIRPDISINDHHTIYEYNDLGQLIQEKTQSGLITTYAYDEMGQLSVKSRLDEHSHALREQRYRYDVLGRLIQQLDDLGCAKLNAPNLTVEQIETFWQKHSIHYTYDDSGLLRTKTDALNHCTQYFYNEHHQLLYTVGANGSVVETRYNALDQLELVCKYSAFLKGSLNALTPQEISQRLECLADKRFDETIRYEYNSIGQVIAKYSGQDGLVRSTYTAFGELEFSTETIDATRHQIRSYSYDRRGLLLTQTDDLGGFNRTTSMAYDAFGLRNKHIDGRGTESKFQFNRRGEQISISTANKLIKRLSYDAFGHILSESNYNGHGSYDYQYDEQNNTLEIINKPLGTKTITQFNAFGDKLSLIDANNNLTTFNYDERGLLIRVDSPENTFKEYHYDEEGQLLWQEDAGGHQIAYTYDAQGHVLTKTLDPQGLKIVTQYRYDALGRQLQVIQANQVQQFTYDDQGRLIQSCIDPEGLNQVTKYAYDARGLLVRQSVLNSKGSNAVTAYEWDNLGRRSAVIRDPEGLNLVTSYQYDEQDNLICETDANHHSTHYVYDALNQCRYQIDARGVITEHIYTNNGDESQTITYSTRISSLEKYTEEELTKTLIKNSAKDHYVFRFFDGAGRITHLYDALGYATLYTYDGNDNVIETVRCNKPVSIDALKQGKIISSDLDDARCDNFAYDGLNQQRFHVDFRGYVNEFRYDANGQLVIQTKFATPLSFNNDEYTIEYIQAKIRPKEAKDKTTRYAYDQAGRLSLEISPQGVIKSYQYNELNQVIACTRYAQLASKSLLGTMDLSEISHSSLDRTNRFIYDTAGRERYRISPEGYVVERGYDDVGNVRYQIAHQHAVPVGQYSLQEIDTMLYEEQGVRRTDYDYDAAGRLLTEYNAAGHGTRYEYDAQGNILSKTDANRAVWTYQYDEMNQLVEANSPIIHLMNGMVPEQRTISTQKVYDSFGNLIEDIRDAKGMRQIRRYEYDLMNRRLRTIYPDVSVNQAGDIASKLRQEAVQTLTEEQRYNGFGEVIATCDKAGNWRYNAYDQGGNLLFQTDSKGGVTQYVYNAFGLVIKTTRYNIPIKLRQNSYYSVNDLATAVHSSEDDRHEWFDYDLDGQLIKQHRDKVRSYNPKTKQYSEQTPTTKKTYNAFGELIQSEIQVNETNSQTTTWYYNQDGHQTAMVDAEGYLTTYTLNAFGDTQSMTEYALRTLSHDISDYQAPSSNTNDRTVTFTYDVLGQVTSKTLMQVSVSHLVNKKLETQICDLTTTYHYDALGHLVQTLDAQGNSAYCYYDSLGQLIAKVGPLVQEGRAATTYSYDGLGNLVETRQWANGASNASDEEQYQLNGVSSNDVITRAQFDAQGLLLSETDGMQHTVNYSYDANGNLSRSVQTVTKANHSTLIQDKRYTYDSEGHLLQTAMFQSNGLKHSEDAQYNRFGELIAKGVNGQYTVHVDYDQLGRVWRSNSQGYYQIYLYDLTGQVTQVVMSSNNFNNETREKGIDLSLEEYKRCLTFNEGTARNYLQRQNNFYDALGHVVTQSKEYTLIQGNELTTSSQAQIVDRWGNMLSFTNALGYETTYAYNAFNEVIVQQLPEVSYTDEHGTVRLIKPVNCYAYDKLGRAIALIDARGNMITKEYDAQGNLIAETDAKNAVRSKHYNLLNQLDRSVNERLAVTSYTYDKANRLTQVITPKTQQHYTYDEAGQLIQQTQGTQETLIFEYDAQGQLIKRQDASGHIRTYEYDEAGHKIKETDGNNKGQQWVYDANGRLISHTDLGNHVTSYEYNTNGLLLAETSTSGKNIRYHYQGDGQLIQYADEGRNELVNYTYDAEGQVLSKKSSRIGTINDGWMRESDYYQYDSLGRLVQIRRSNPEDTEVGFPTEDKTLLAVDYEYDQVGNIRHTKASAKYPHRAYSTSEDYFTYDENNRMIINKGQLINDTISMTSAQGSILSYDAAGNIEDAQKYEQGFVQNYHYGYTADNQLELIQKNKRLVQTREYDEAGHTIAEHSFNESNSLAQTNRMTYVNGQLMAYKTIDKRIHKELSQTSYIYDEVGNLSSSTYTINGGSSQKDGATITHQYSYAYWDNYQQAEDHVTFSAYKSHTTTGQSTRYYDINGLLMLSTDNNIDNNNRSNTISYRNSSMDGIKERQINGERISYLTIAGNTLGDLKLNDDNSQQLTIYGGFTPTGSQMKGRGGIFGSAFAPQPSRFNSLQRTPGDVANNTLPDAPQDNLGSYTLQSGDSLESIALQVYGDSSLWYLIADANGISERKGTAGSDSALRIGQRLTIPSAATGQHHTNGTHKILNANYLMGDTSATSKIPTMITPKPKASHHSLLSKVVVAVVAVLATVLTAGVLGMAAGATVSSFGSLFSTGLSVLAGSGITGMTGTLTAGFTAGFIGSIASQGAANALGMQEGMDVTGALITGLTTAATAGVGNVLGTSLKSTTDLINGLAINKGFSISSAAMMMEENALSQGLNTALRKQAHFDWEELGIATLTGGILGSEFSQKIGTRLNNIDYQTGILNKELHSLTSAGINSLATGTHFDATQVLADNLGSALGNAAGNLGTALSNLSYDIKEGLENIFSPHEVIEDLSLASDLKEMEDLRQEFNNYRARQLDMGDESNLETKIPIEKVQNNDSLEANGKDIPISKVVPHSQVQTLNSNQENESFLYGSELSENENTVADQITSKPSNKNEKLKKKIEVSSINEKKFLQKSVSKEYGLAQKILYIERLYPFVYKAAKETGLSFELMLAQGALETGWGEKIIKKTNNMFNIKAEPSWKGKRRPVKDALEYINGQKVHEDAYFRTYKSIEDSVNDRVKFLSENRNYSGVFKSGVKGSLEKEALALEKGGYATVPDYSKILKAVAYGPTMRKALEQARKHYGY